MVHPLRLPTSIRQLAGPFVCLRRAAHIDRMTERRMWLDRAHLQRLHAAGLGHAFIIKLDRTTAHDDGVWPAIGQPPFQHAFLCVDAVDAVDYGCPVSSPATSRFQPARCCSVSSIKHSATLASVDHQAHLQQMQNNLDTLRAQKVRMGTRADRRPPP